MGADDLVVVGTFLKHFEADLARSALEAAGIEAIIRSDDCGGQRPHFWMGGIEILVRAEDAAYASEVIESQSTPVDDESTD
jgi:hypothetical protein